MSLEGAASWVVDFSVFQPAFQATRLVRNISAEGVTINVSNITEASPIAIAVSRTGRVRRASLIRIAFLASGTTNRIFS